MSVNTIARASIAIACLSCMTSVSCSTASDKPDGHVDARSDAASGSESSCDASEPPRTFYKDGDRDGFGVPGPEGTHGCYSQTPAGFSLNARDCDDGDPLKQLERFRDRDGDGYGEAHASCVGEAQTGYVDRNDDCDDDDAERSPVATETWFDGSDRDCDGADNPSSCISAGNEPSAAVDRDIMVLPALDGLTIERVTSCDGADLYFAVLGACHTCGGGFATIVIGNRGTQATRLKVESNAGTVEAAATLEPQHASEPLVLTLAPPDSVIRVSTLGGVTDCDPDNDARTVEIGFTECQ